MNRFVGVLHAARCTAIIWIHHAEDPKYRIAAKYGVQMTFGTTMLTLRKVQDFWAAEHVQVLMPKETEARHSMEWVRGECAKHNTRDAANLLFAHYAPSKSDLPLSEREIRALIEAAVGTTEKEIVEWTALIIDKLRLIRDDIMSRHGITTLIDEETTT